MHFCHRYANALLLRDVAVTRPVSFDQLWSKPGFSQKETLQLLLCETSFCWFEKKIIGLWWLLLEWFVLWQIIITSRYNIVEGGALLVCVGTVEPPDLEDCEWVQVWSPATWITRWSVWLLLAAWLNLLISESSCLNISMDRLPAVFWPSVAASLMLCSITAPSSRP